MTFEEFAERPQRLMERIERQVEKVDRLQAACEQTTTIFSDAKVQTSHGNRRETMLIDYIDCKQVLNDLLDKYTEAADEVQAWLYENLEFDDASMLEWRYCSGLKNAEIAVKMRYREITVRHRISDAVRLAKDKYYQQHKERG